MSTPQGKLLFTTQQSSRGPRTRLLIWIVLAAIGLISGSLNIATLFAALLALISGLCALITLPYVLRDNKKMEIYEDGLVLRRVKDDSLWHETTWNEISDILWDSRGNASMAAAGGASFGVVGFLVGAAIDSSRNEGYAYENCSRFTIILPTDKWPHKFLFDKAFQNFETARVYLLDASRKVWLASTLDDLKAGRTVTFGKLQLSQDGVTDGKQQAAWKNVSGIEMLQPTSGLMAINYYVPGTGYSSTMNQMLGHRGSILWSVVETYRKQARA